jgi:MoxR-like ATPase
VNFYMMRLGADSVPVIKEIDGHTGSKPVEFEVQCKQVPVALEPGDYVFIWLGTDNGKGGSTSWKQGLRALGKVLDVSGPAGYNETKTVRVSAGYILPQSVGKQDAANSDRVNYRELFNLPVMGSNNYSSQVIQLIDPAKPAQNLGGLVEVIEERHPGFKAAIASVYSGLGAFLSKLPTFAPPVPVHAAVATSVPALEPVGSWDLDLASLDDLGGLVGMRESAVRAVAALKAGMHIILTGPPGTGKTKLAAKLCEKAGFSSWTVPATDQWTTFETIGGYFPIPYDEAADKKSDALDFMPGAIVDSIMRGNCLIVDEINRADIDKAFGEMFTLLAGSSVTLPYKRRGPDGFLRIRIQVDDVAPEADIDVIPLPRWWRLIGAMNDADKASLKRLSLAFVRRFAFIPIGLPPRQEYEKLLDQHLIEALGKESDDPRLKQVLESIKRIFCSIESGLAACGMPLGPAIPLAMLNHIVRESVLDSGRSADMLLASALDLYVAPQFQGRADVHEAWIEQINSEISEAAIAQSVANTLSVWTGYDA